MSDLFRRRGQTLVMMALTCLLLTLMVLMTISIGAKIKEKMELQTIADASAYTNAVATARTFNAVSMMNRVGIAHVTGVLAIQSLISWATFYHSSLYETARGYRFFNIQFRILRALCCIPFSPCSSFCGCAVAGSIATGLEQMKLNMEKARFYPMFIALDIQAAIEAINYLLSADFVHMLGQLPTLLFLNNFISGQSGARSLMNSSARPGTVYNELRVDGQPDSHNKDEIGLPWAFGIPPDGAIIAINPLYSHHAFAAMGSRLHPFITGRGSPWFGMAGMIFFMRLLTVNSPSNGVTFFLPMPLGSGYVSLLPGPRHGIGFWPMALFSRFMSADDHSQQLTIYIGQLPCPIFRLWPANIQSQLWSGQGLALHRGNNWTDNYHIIGGLFRNYPWFMDYNFTLVSNMGNIDGQPKNFGVARRDYGARPSAQAADPYNPLLRFSFGGAGGPTQLDMAQKTGPLREQVAVGTGVTYYHRGNMILGYHSGVEPPNFFNPFWRAGLSRVDVDNKGINGDIQGTVGGAAADSIDGLKANGFKGWQ